MGGIALASKLRKQKSVSLTYIGDGGASTGEFSEALNFAAVKKLPLIVIAENNGYAYSTPTSDQMAIDSLVKRGEAFGVHSERVDGNDALAVYEATRRAVDRGRSGKGPSLIEAMTFRMRGGKGPSLIEAMTFRMRGHAEHDDQRYVPKKLIEKWAARDPIDRFRALLLERGHMSQDDIDRLDADVEDEVTRGLEVAEKSPMPPPERALEGVYHGVPRARDGRPRIR